MIGYYRIKAFLKKILSNEQFDIISWKLWDTDNHDNVLRRKKYYSPYYINKCKNPESKYYIFRVSMQVGGLIMSAAKYYIACAEWAERNGYIPIMDIETEENYKNNNIGKENYWDYIFEQPPVIDAIEKPYVFAGKLNEYKSDNIINALLDNADMEGCVKTVYDEDYKRYYGSLSIYTKKWLRFNKDFIQTSKKDIPHILESENVLGVMVRENFTEGICDNERLTQRAKECMEKHPHSISIDSYIDLVEKYMDEWSIDKIYLTCQCSDTVEMFKTRFQDCVYITNRNRISIDELLELMNSFEYKQSVEELIGYCEDVYAVSKCNSLIANKSSGTTIALLLNGGEYEHVHILEDFNHIDRY